MTGRGTCPHGVRLDFEACPFESCEPVPEPWYVSPQLLWFAALVVVVLYLMLGTGCQYQRPACAVVDLANEACRFIEIRYPDGRVEHVPKTEAVGAIQRAGLVR